MKKETPEMRLKLIRNSLRLTQGGIADAMGMKSTKIRDMELGKTSMQPYISKLLHYAYGVNEEYIEKGIGPMFFAEQKDRQGDYIYLPMVAGQIRAGAGTVADNTVDIRLAFRREWVQRKGDPSKMALIRVTGDSMEDTLFSGDIVLVNHARNIIDPQGGIYAIYFKGDDEISIKRLQIVYPSRKIMVISDNQEKYPKFEVAQEDIHINGKVIWYGRELER